MEESFVFNPPRRPGIIFHISVLLVLSAAGIWALWQAASTDIGPAFLFHLLLALLTVVVFPLVAYRAYALQSGSYTMERNGIHLRWGMRLETIPMDKVAWAHRVEDLSAPIPRPWLRWHGAVLGVRRLPGGEELEYMAATTRGVVVIAAGERYYAISPDDPDAFLLAYQRFSEMGSLDPLPALAQHPTFIFAQVWRTPAARALVLAGLILCIVVLGWVSFVIPTREQVHMGFYPDGTPGALAPSVQLLLLPVLCTLLYVVDLFLGMFFFRRRDTQPLSYLLWGSGVLMPLLSVVALFFILNAN